jgi:hypothetical protein
MTKIGLTNRVTITKISQIGNVHMMYANAYLQFGRIKGSGQSQLC